MKLFLDDIRMPVEARVLVTEDIKLYSDNDWVIVRSYGEFVEWVVENGLPDYVSFDHDLGDNFDLRENQNIDEWFDISEYTGYDCAKWLVDYCMDNNLPLPEYQTHSANPVGRKNINSYLENANKYMG